MDKVVTRLKKKYRERLINRENQWPPCVSHKPIVLKLVEQSVESSIYCERSRDQRQQNVHAIQRTLLNYDDIFKVKRGEKPIRKVLVEGDAGMGKTTFCNSIAEDWSNGKLFQQFDLVLLLPLGQNGVASARSTKELLTETVHSNAEICETVSSYLKADEGEKVLIIADGWDKLIEKEESFIYQFLFQKFPFVSVILTSRPNIGSARLPHIDRFTKMHGFTEESIAEYIQSEFSSDESKADSLLQKLKDNPTLESVCSIPLNCAIVIHLWRTCSEKELITDTQTNLYTKIILNIILHSIQNIEMCKGILSLHSFDSLPECLQQSWWDLCNFAFITLTEQKNTFTSEELGNIVPVGLANIQRFGLLKSTVLFGETGYVESIHFLHPVIQEYLTALHLLRNEQHAVNRRLLKSKSTLESLCMVWKLFIGIQFGLGHRALKNAPPVTIDMIKEILETFHWKGCFIAQCAYEAKGSLTDEVNEVMRKCSTNFQPYSAYDYACIVHVIENCQQYSCTTVDLEFLGLDDDQIAKLARALQSANNYHIIGLHLSGNRITERGIQDIFINGCNALKSLSILRLSHNLLQQSGLRALKKIVEDPDLPFCELLVIELCGCATSDSVVELASLTESVLAKCRHLQILDLSYNPMGSNCEGVRVLANSLSHVTVHQEENMDESTQSVESSISASSDSNQMSGHDFIEHEAEEVHNAVDDAAEAFQRLDFHLNRTNLGNEGLVSFISVGYIQLNKLELQGNGINSVGASNIADSITSGMLQIDSLNLSDNPIGIEGIVVLCEMLSKDCHIKEMFLCGCITNKSTDSETTTEQLYHLPLNPTQSLDYLILNDNYLADRNIHALGGFLHVCPCIHYLHCNYCEISSNELNELSEALQKSASDENPLKLQMWKLVGNHVDSEGVDNLKLTMYPDVVDIDLKDNPATKESLARLKKVLKKVSL